ncbi:MAG: tetratricopeptide repeat protein [Saprospiraceae bacterium]|nr:tetratricopeptide repeat protein [Saprospiraceae bacterium]
MKPTLRNTLYGALVLFCLLAAGFIFLNGKSKTPFYELKERTGALAAAPEWAATKARVTKLMADLNAKPGDAKLTLQLSKEFMQEGRATGDFSYYNKAALDLIDGVLAKDAKNFEAICLKAMVYLSQHRFAEGKEIALAGLQLNPYNAFIYGLLVDANVELGNYAEAVQMCDKMVGVRPDIRSYSRVSYLREIHGDTPGAIEAIKLAVAAGYPGYEDTEWARMVLAHLYEDTGAPELAELQYKTALQERPDYPFALAGLARIARFKKDYPTAIRHLERAKDIMSDASFFEELAEVYRLNQESDKADECTRVTLNALLADHLTASKDKNMGHFSDMELATLYLKTNELDKALEHARIEQQRRPENIDACETLAWVLYRQGKATEALPLIRTALRTQSQKPERLVRAGLIQVAAGQPAEGQALIQQGLRLKPYLDEALAAEAYSKIKG